MASFKSDFVEHVSVAALGLFDLAPEPAFDRITECATKAFEVPVSLLSIIDPDGDRQFFKSQQGLEAPWNERQETPLTHSFCQYVVATHAPLVVSDARENKLVSCNLAIRDLGVVAYLGVPVTEPNGQCIGALCAIHTIPREWSKQEVELLACLADGISKHLLAKAAILAGTDLLSRDTTFANAS